MNKTPDYTLKASKAYHRRLKEKGWTRYNIFIPSELKDKLKAYRDQLIAELEATKQEGK